MEDLFRRPGLHPVTLKILGLLDEGCVRSTPSLEQKYHSDFFLKKIRIINAAFLFVEQQVPGLSRAGVGGAG